MQQFEKSLVIDITEANNKLQNTTGSIFCRYKKLLLTSSGCTDLENLVASFQRGMCVCAIVIIMLCRKQIYLIFFSFAEDKTILDSIIKSIQKLCTDLHHTTYEVIFAPIFTQLLLVQKAPAWSLEINKMSNLSSDLPDYSFAPQEYITQVGQYLMTLPQHLEPFLLRDNPSLTQALKAADPQYVQGSSESGFTSILLDIVARGTCQMFQDQTLGICQLNSVACKQLATDIGKFLVICL